ncbi:hypothetical protein M408DRAFT_331716 [Serendipita vermifera MAFF 305830]|uniref:Inclusion body clearance protein iml2 n=1 Tax=Serendipita vermifera MAFF 305830 TaxID=933852 RepID=A0A0C3AXC4_SERVB|nr:hypothetical protein M408DRAFT_331716 [Serendipita vermifera MAFF 305830]
MAGTQNASLEPLKLNGSDSPGLSTPVQGPNTAPASSASFATMQDQKPPLSTRMSRSASANKLSQKAKESGSKPKHRSYDPDADLRPDIETCRQSLELFLASRMGESEALLRDGDPKLERLYIASGYGLIQSVKAFMSFEDKDLTTALDLSKSGSALANKHRKSLSITSRVTGLVTGSTSSVAFFKSMTPTQRHAELVYGECLAQKAILGIVYSGDWLQFIKEAINMRSCIGLYRSMFAYLEAIDAEAEAARSETESSGTSTPYYTSGASTPNKQAQGSASASVDIKASKSSKSSHAHSELPDEDFRSGVYLGMGVIHLILSLLPGRVLPILELFGYKGDRATALRLLERVGGWGVVKEKVAALGKTEKMHTGDIIEPGVSKENEGLRRPLCDMVLLMFHLVFSTITYNGIDVPFASQALAYNAARFPRGIFFLFGQGRLALFKGDPLGAIDFYMTGMEVVGGKDALRGLEGVGLPRPERHSKTTNGVDETDDALSDPGSDESEFKSLQGLALWELAIARTALWDIRGSVGCWRRLREEAGWSKSVYAYGLAVGLYEIGDEGADGAKIADVQLEVVDEQLKLDEKKVVPSGGAEEVKKSEAEEAITVMESVPGLLKRIAGKSIPFEKFVTRRAKKFKAQGNRLCLPALELAYAHLALPRTPRKVLVEKMLPTVDAALEILRTFEGHEEQYCGVGKAGKAKAAEVAKARSTAASGEASSQHTEKREEAPSISEKGKEAVSTNGYWDDYCLAQFLRGVCLRYIAYPDSFVIVTDENPLPKAAAQAKEAFEFVLAHGTNIVYDHHIVYWTHYELGKLEARNGDKDEARKHIELVLSGKVLEVNWNGRKGKYSLENALNVRANAAIEGLEQDQLL